MPSKLPKRTMHALGCDRTICSTGWPCMAAVRPPAPCRLHHLRTQRVPGAGVARQRGARGAGEAAPTEEAVNRIEIIDMLEARGVRLGEGFSLRTDADVE